MRQENEVKRLEQDLCDSVSDPSEAVWLSQLLLTAVQERGRLRAAFERDFSAPNADVNGAAARATLLSAPTDHLTAPRLICLQMYMKRSLRQVTGISTSSGAN